MKIADLFIKLGLKKDGFDRGIDGSKKKVSAFSGSIKRMGAAIVAAFSVRAVISFFSSSVRAYDIQAKAEQQLLTALKGRRSAQQDLIRQAQALQKITLYGDEETIRAQSLIAAFVKEKDQIKTIIPLVQDLASAKMMQLSVAADLVSKTLGSSTNALSRYGIEVTGSVGSVERLQSLVKGLNDAFGGQAIAAAKAGVGAIKQMKNAYGDFLETVGKDSSSWLNQAARFATALLEYATGNMKKSIEENKTDAEKFAEELKNSTDKHLTELQFSWKHQADIYFKNWKDAYDKGDDVARAHYATQYDLAKQMVDSINAEIKSREKATPVIEKQVSLLDAAKLAVKEAEKALEDFKNKPGKFAGEASAEDYIKKLGELQKAAIDANKYLSQLQERGASIPGMLSMRGGESSGIGSNSDMQGAGIATTKNQGPGLGVSHALDGMLELIKKADEYTTQLNDTIKNGLSDAASSLAEGIGQLAAGEITPKEFGGKVLQMIGSFMEQLGGLMVTYAINMALFGKSILDPLNPLNWGIALAAGLAMIAAGAAISSIGKKATSSGSAGSYAASGYNAGNYNQSRAANVLNGNVTFELHGTMLQGVLNNTNRRNSIIG